MKKNKELGNIIIQELQNFLNELFDPNGGNLYEPVGLNPQVVKLFENVEDLYQMTLKGPDKYWSDVNIDNYPGYNKPGTEDNKKAIEHILNGMKKKYPDKDWKKIEKPMRLKIEGGIT